MIPWLIFFGVMCAVTFAMRNDKPSFRFCALMTASYVVFSVAIGALNYVQLGKVFL